MTSSASSSKVSDDQISIAIGHPVLQNQHPISSKNHKEPPKPEPCCECCIVGFLISYTVAFFVAAAIQSRTPPLPKFSVSSLTPSFNNATSSYQIAVNFIIRKPDSDSIKSIAYDNIVASLYYDNNFIGTTALFPFKQKEERNSVAVVKAKFTVEPKIDVGPVGVFDVRVFADATANYREWSRKLDVLCEDIWVESGSMAGRMKDCSVDVHLNIRK